MHRFYVGIKALIERENNILLLRRTKGSSSWWDLPGGRLCKSESIAEGFDRELREELGVTGYQGVLLNNYIVPDFPDGTGLFICVYSATLSSYEIRLSSEHVDCEWIPSDEAPEVMLKEGSSNTAGLLEVTSGGLSIAIDALHN